MNGFTLLLIASTFGVDYGWQPSADGQLEYIVQIEPVTLIALQQGQEIVSQIDPYVQTVRRFRIRQGTDLVPRRGEPPRQPPPTLPADTIESQVPGVTFGWQPMENQCFELTIQISPNRLAALRSGEEIAAEVPQEVTALGRLKIQSGVDKLARVGANPVEGQSPTNTGQPAGDPAPAWPLAGTGGQPAATATEANSRANGQIAPPTETPNAKTAEAATAQVVDSSSARQPQVNSPQQLQPPVNPYLAAPTGSTGDLNARDWAQGAAAGAAQLPAAQQPARQQPTGGQYPGVAWNQGTASNDSPASVYGAGQLDPVGNASQANSAGAMPNYQGAGARWQNPPPANTWVNQDGVNPPVSGRPDGYAASPYDSQSPRSPLASNSGGWTSVPPNASAPAYQPPNGYQASPGLSPYPSQPPYAGQGAGPTQAYPTQGYPSPSYPHQANANVPTGGWGQPQYSASLGGQAAAAPSAPPTVNPAKGEADSLPMPWEDPAEKTFLVAYFDQKAKQESKTPDFWDSLAEISNDRSLYYLAGGGSSGYRGDEPWWPLTMAMLALFASLGGNFYIGWIAVGIYRRYLDVVIGGEEDRYDRHRDEDSDRHETSSRDRSDRYDRPHDGDRRRARDRSERRDHAGDYE